MTSEELVTQLCEVIKESEINAQIIYDNTESIEETISDLDIPLDKKNKIIYSFSCGIAFGIFLS